MSRCASSFWSREFRLVRTIAVLDLQSYYIGSVLPVFKHCVGVIACRVAHITAVHMPESHVTILLAARNTLRGDLDSTLAAASDTPAYLQRVSTEELK